MNNRMNYLIKTRKKNSDSPYLIHFNKCNKTLNLIYTWIPWSSIRSGWIALNSNHFIDFNRTKMHFCGASVLPLPWQLLLQILFNCNLQMRYFCVMKPNTLIKWKFLLKILRNFHFHVSNFFSAYHFQFD